MRKQLRALWLIATTAFRADPLRSVAVLAVSAVEGVSGIVGVYWLKVIADAAVAHSVRSAAIGAAGFGATVLISAFTNVPRFYWQILVQEKTGFLVDQQVIGLIAGLPGLEHLERPDYQDEIALLRNERETLAQTVNSIITTVRVAGMLASLFALLGSVDPALLLLPLFGVPGVLVSGKVTRLGLAATQQTAEATRLTAHLFGVGTSAQAGKELRVFGLGDVIRTRHLNELREVDRTLRAAGLRGAMYSGGASLAFAVGYVGAMVLVVVRAVAGSATPGDVLMALTLAGQVSAVVGGTVATITWLLNTLRTGERLLWLIDYARRFSAAPPDPAPVPSAIRDGISLRDVTFRYPGTEKDVLAAVSLDIPAGRTVAIVGENGVGKTTLVKLLSRMYVPTSGSIAVDGVDLARFGVQDWRRVIAAGFQDFARFEFVARESVGCGSLDAMDDSDAVGAALDRAGASDVVATLPAGLETQLGRSFDGGTELSGGQWQKLALGRAMMRPQPLLLLLDEPTAALDADTEHALFERYAGAARRAATTNGAITVLVSHRFSTVRMADLIVVVDDGRVVEHGSHDELVSRRGLYAELYELQARAYR